MPEENKRKVVEYGMSSALVTAIFMSLAWSLRGQFGHLKGAMIPGVFAALSLAIFFKQTSDNKKISLGIILGAIGFAAGGHLSYGKLFEAAANAQSFIDSWKIFLKIFITGALWGGLAMTFLGFAFSEVPLTRRDRAFFLFVILGWVVLLGFLNLETWDRRVFAASLLLLHFYNSRSKKSKVIFSFGLWGVLGFGAAFELSAALLHFGNQGVFSSGWPWWTLRDQFIGFFGGLALAAAASQIKNPAEQELHGESMRLRRFAAFLLLVILPGVNTINVIHHWWVSDKTYLQGLVRVIAVMGAALFMIFTYAIIKAPLRKFTQDSFRLNLVSSSLFLIWYLSLLAISKETLLFGLVRWEAADTFFLIDAFILTLACALRHKYLSKPPLPKPSN